MSEKKNHIDRREFIVTGSLVVAGLAVPSMAAAGGKPAPSSPLALSLGFLGERDDRFQSAKSLLSGDPSLFSRGARIAFRGIQRFASDALQVSIDVLYQTNDGVVAPFFAFTHSEQKKKVFNNSSPSSFLVPVPTTGTIDLAVRATRASSQVSSATVSFAVNSAPNSIKLSRGTYIYAITDRNVDWGAVRVADGVKASSFVAGSQPLLLRTNGGQDVNFDYVVMTVTAAAS